MKTQRRQFRAVSMALALVLMGIAWISFAPIQFGGQAAYIMVTGNSMEPGYHGGDLVILRQAAHYQVGDIVTYRHPEIGPIIHRIIGREGDHFIFQGDNNDWIDSHRPVQSELIGKAWIHVPSAGKVIVQLRSPRNMAILAAVMGVIIMSTVIGRNDQRQQRSHDRRQAGEGYRTLRYLSETREGLIFALAVLGFASLVLALFAFTRPTSRTVSNDINYEHAGVFSYSAAAPSGVYDRDTVQTGEPVFRQLTNSFNVDFAYKLLADQPAELAGTYRLIAEISDASGWKRTVELQPKTAFSAAKFTANGAVDLSKVQALIDSLEQQTGLQRPEYKLAVVPEVVIHGSLAGQELRDTFAPRLEFRLDKLQLQFVKDSSTSDPLKPSQTGLLKRFSTEPNTISLLSLDLEVTMARWLSLIGLGLSLGSVLVLGLIMFRVARSDEAARIRLKYGRLLIDVRDGDPKADAHVVKVATIDDLAKLAERNGGMILHAVRSTTYHYFVQDAGVTYCYQAAGSNEALPVLVEDAA